MIKYSMLIVLFAAGSRLFAQTSNDSSYLLQLNQQIDQYVVERNVVALDSLYAPDFVLSHGSGRLEG